MQRPARMIPIFFSGCLYAVEEPFVLHGYARAGETFRDGLKDVCAVDRDSLMRSKEVVVLQVRLSVKGYCGKTEPNSRGRLARRAGMQIGMKENRRKSWVCR